MGGIPQPLVVRELVSLMTLSAPSIDHRVEDLEKKLEMSQLGFQETVMKLIQSISKHMTLMVRNHGSNPPPMIKSKQHVSALWCVQYGQHGHTK